MKKIVTLGTVIALTAGANAAVVFDDDFTSTTLDTDRWNIDVGSAVTFDAANDQLDYAHTAGTTRRFLSYNASAPDTFLSTQGYAKVEISNFSGSESIRVGWVGSNAANNQNYMFSRVAANSTIELVFNTSASSISFDNGAGWSGTLAALSGLATTDGGTNTTALTFGTAVTSGLSLRGFGFANFGNATVFPTSSFSADRVIVHDSAVVAVVPEPSSTALLGLGGLALVLRRRR